MMFFKNLVFGLGALVVGLEESVHLPQYRWLGIYLLGNSAPRPYEEYLMVLSFASLASRFAT